MRIMTYVNMYFEQLIEPMFQRDEQGRELFFPMGIGSRGRIVPDAATGDRVRRSMRWFWLALLLIWIPLAVAFVNHVQSLWALTGEVAVSIAALWVFTAVIARGLEVSSRRMTPSNQFTSLLARSSYKRLVTMTGLSAMMTLCGAWPLLFSAWPPGQPVISKPAALFATLFFAGTTMIWGRLALMKRREGRS